MAIPKEPQRAAARTGRPGSVTTSMQTKIATPSPLPPARAARDDRPYAAAGPALRLSHTQRDG
jgi:hypothetical protein